MSESLSQPDVSPEPAPGAEPSTAGGLLRQARQARGLHIAALATSIKVTPRKLELLEADRFDELPGATFTRALAQTVCRTLKIDPAPVLALLPASVDKGLERMSRGLNEPFRDRPGRQLPADFSFLKNPVRLGAIALVVLAVVVYVLPGSWIGERLRFAPSASAPAASEPASTTVTETVGDATVPVVGPDASASAAVVTVHSAPAEAGAEPAASVPSGVATAPVTGALQLRTTSESWVEVIDRRGVVLFSRMLQPGETVGLDGTSPLRLKIGNASATRVTYKGEGVDLAPVTSRDNVAKLELK